MIEDFILVDKETVDKNLCLDILDFVEFMIEKKYFFDSKSENPDVSTRKDVCAHFPNAHYAMSQDNVVLPENLVPTNWTEVYLGCMDKLASLYCEEHLIKQMLHCPGFKAHQVTKGNGYFSFHYEADCKKVSDRVITFMTYLEAPESGGETEFLFQSKRFKPEIGTTLIWPAAFTHLHRGNPVLAGKKTYLTGWYFFKD